MFGVCVHVCRSKLPIFFFFLGSVMTFLIVHCDHYLDIFRTTIYHYLSASNLHYNSTYHHASCCTSLFKNRDKVSRHGRVHLLLCHSITILSLSISFYSAYQSHHVYHRLLLLLIKYSNVSNHNI